MNGFKRLMEEASDMVEKEIIANEKQTIDTNQLRIKQTEERIQQFHHCLPHLPIIREILFEHHKVFFDHYPETPEAIINTKNGTGEYDCGGGYEYDRRLFQKTEIDDDRTISLAWAIYFEDVFGRQVYIMPYKKYKRPGNGLACTIVSKNEYRFFPHDVPRSFAIQWLAEQIKRQK